MNEYLEKIRQRFAEDKFATNAAGIVIDEASEHYAKCSMKIEATHLNAVGGVMGGAIFTLADFCFAIASNGLGDEGGTVSLSSQITFLGAAKGKTLIGIANCVKNGRTTNFYTIDITDELGTKVAMITTNGFRTVRP